MQNSLNLNPELLQAAIDLDTTIPIDALPSGRSSSNNRPMADRHRSCQNRRSPNSEETTP
jgi:hypothetical protein